MHTVEAPQAGASDRPAMPVNGVVCRCMAAALQTGDGAVYVCVHTPVYIGSTTVVWGDGTLRYGTGPAAQECGVNRQQCSPSMTTDRTISRVVAVDWSTRDRITSRGSHNVRFQPPIFYSLISSAQLPSWGKAPRRISVEMRVPISIPTPLGSPAGVCTEHQASMQVGCRQEVILGPECVIQHSVSPWGATCIEVSQVAVLDHLSGPSRPSPPP